MRRARWRLLWPMLAVAALLACSSAAQPQGQDDGPPSQARAAPPQSPPAETLPAVTLAALDGDEQAMRQVAGVLRADNGLAEKRVVLQLLVQTNRVLKGKGAFAELLLEVLPRVPAELEADWAAALGRFESERVVAALGELAADDGVELDQRRLAVRALGEHRRRFAARELVELTQRGVDERVRGAAFEALGQLTHQPELGRDAAAWSAWYREARRMSSAQWQAMLHENLLRQNRAGERSSETVRERLTQAQRALYRATADEQRPALLAEMLNDPLDLVRSLAMGLARQRAEDNREFDEPLRATLRGRLSDPLAGVREQSATLLGQLLDERAADVMAARLNTGQEQDPAVRLAYLNALGQMPRANALAPAEGMLEDPQLRSAAAGMLAAAYRAKLGDGAFWAALGGRVRSMLAGVDTPRPQMVTLLGLVIEQDDAEAWSRIGGWLAAEDDRVREAAVRAWASSGRSLVELARRSDDTVIRPIALRAVAERGEDRQTLEAIASRRPDDAEDIRLWEQALVAMAGRVPAPTVLETQAALARDNGETRSVRKNMLAAALEREDTPDPPTREHLALLLARAELREQDDAPALVVLDYEAALEHRDILSDEQADAARRDLTRAYLADRRIGDALATAQALLRPEDDQLIDNAADDPLVDSLIAAVRDNLEQGRSDDASQLLAGIRQLLDGGISAELDDRLLKLQKQINGDPDPDPDPDADPDPDPDADPEPDPDPDADPDPEPEPEDSNADQAPPDADADAQPLNPA